MFNPSAAGARDRRLLQAAMKTLQHYRVWFSDIFEWNDNNIANIWPLNGFNIYKCNKKPHFGLLNT